MKFWCEGKDPFTAADAKKMAKVQRKRHPGHKMSAYKCTACGQWHVGQNLKGKKRKLKNR